MSNSMATLSRATLLSLLMLCACDPTGADRSAQRSVDGSADQSADHSADDSAGRHADAPAAGDAPSDSLAIDPTRITVSGISAGGMMAHQLHVAYPELFSGAAAIAAGPYGCAEGSLATAMARCMGTAAGELPVEEFAAMLRTDAEAGRIGDPAELADDRVWLFRGTGDTVVAAGVSDALAGLYAHFLPPENIRYVNDIDAAHHFPAAGRGHPCDESKPPFVGDCGYDAAGELLQFLDPGLNPPTVEIERGEVEMGDATTDPITPDDLTEVPLPGATAAGLAEAAWLYAPAACRAKDAGCALHLVLHGCAQAASQVGTAFIEQSGYLRWAEANNMVLAFPQVEPAIANPYACWDWWGYTGADYRWRAGAQMGVLADWVEKLVRPSHDW